MERGGEERQTLPVPLLMLSWCQVGCSAHTVLLSPVMRTGGGQLQPVVRGRYVAVILGWERVWRGEYKVTVKRYSTLAG